MQTGQCSARVGKDARLPWGLTRQEQNKLGQGAGRLPGLSAMTTPSSTAARRWAPRAQPAEELEFQGCVCVFHLLRTGAGSRLCPQDAPRARLSERSPHSTGAGKRYASGPFLVRELALPAQRWLQAIHRCKWLNSCCYKLDALSPLVNSHAQPN